MALSSYVGEKSALQVSKPALPADSLSGRALSEVLGPAPLQLPKGRTPALPPSAPNGAGSDPPKMSRRYTTTPLDLRTEDPRSGLCRYCGEPLPARKPTRGRPPVTCSTECKRLYTNRQKWVARIQLARRESRLTHDRSDGVLPWAVSYDDVATYDDDADTSAMEGYGLVYGDLDLLHGAELKKAVHAFEEARAAA